MSPTLGVMSALFCRLREDSLGEASSNPGFEVLGVVLYS